MATKNESSVLFSLQELMGLEEDRVRQEDLARQRMNDELSLIHISEPTRPY